MRLVYQGRKPSAASSSSSSSLLASLAVVVATALSVKSVSAQPELEYLDQPTQLWQKSAGNTQEGNGLYWSPDGSAVVGTFSDGSVRAFSPSTGDQVASYAPDALLGSTLSGLGGITFAAYGTDSPYMVYAVADNATDPTTAQTRVICLTPSGEPLLESVPLEGVPAGTPVTSYDGRYIYITHNVDQLTGIFTVLDTFDAVSNGGLIPVMYEYVNGTNPFSPIGYYHNPTYGYYDGGENNTNDIFIWAFDTAKDATAVGTGQMFAFQMPMDPAGNMNVALLGIEARTFQASTAPVLTKMGLSMYWAVTRAEQYCWVGNNATKREFFNRGRTNSVSLSRGDPAWISSRASPSLSHGFMMASSNSSSNSSSGDLAVFGPGASNQIFRLDENYTELLTTNTSWIVSSRVAVSPDDAVIYYATQDGVVAQLDATTLDMIWSTTTLSPVSADIVLNSAGTILFVADINGVITAYQVASSGAPTPSPTMPGTSDFPSASPTEGPGVPTALPTAESSNGAPTSGGGGAPSPNGGGGGGSTNSTSGATDLFCPTVALALAAGAVLVAF